MEVNRTAIGEDHPDFAVSLNNLAMLYVDIGDHVFAVPLFHQAIAIDRTALGEDHPALGGSLMNLAASCIATGRTFEALSPMQRAASVDDRMIGQYLTIGSDRQRMAYLNKVIGNLYLLLSLVLQHLSDYPAAARTAMELVLRRKAITAEAVATQRDAVMGGKYPALKPMLSELVAQRTRIARKTLAGPGPEGFESHLRGLAEWESQKEGLEAELARQIPEMNLEQKLGAADRRAVALGLPEGVTLIEFVRFPVVDFKAVRARGEPRWKPDRYVAFALPSGRPDDVRMIDLGEAEPIDRLIADFRAGIIAEAAMKDGRRYGETAGGSRPVPQGRRRLGLTSGSVRPVGSGTRESRPAADRSRR